MNVPDFSPPGINYTIDVERYDSMTEQFVSVKQITGVQRNEFPYTVADVEGGVYSIRVDGQTPIGVRTFSIARSFIPQGEGFHT